MSCERLKVALVGCGRIGSYTRPELMSKLPPGWLPLNHAEAIRSTSGLELASVCDVDPASLSRAMATYGVPGFADFSRQFAETHPDIVSVATRTSVREAVVEAALEAGSRGFHLEKPVATSMAACRRILAGIAAQGAPVSYGTTRRGMDVFRLAHRILTAGEIGELTSIDIQYGRSLLLWAHPHSVDLMLYFSGGRHVASVRARCTFGTEVTNGMCIDDDPIVEEATVVLDKGVVGRIGPSEGMNVILTGRAGRLAIGEDGRWLDVERPGAATRRIAAAPTMSGTVRMFHDLEAAVRSGAPLSIAPEDIAVGTNVLLAIAISARAGGAAVAPADVPDGFTVTGRYRGNFA